MTLRSCIYKSCENYIDLRCKSINDVKLFSFPKNPERRQKWIELGKVPQNLPESMYYFCSDHFDKKFMAVTNKRTVLVGEAVPFPYVNAQVEECNSDEEGELNFFLYGMEGSNNVEEKNRYSDEQNILVESTTMISEQQRNFDDEQHTDEYIVFSGDERSEEDSTISNNIKRKLENANDATSSDSKIIKTSLQKSFQKPNVKTLQQVIPFKNIALNPTKPNTFSKTEICDDDVKANELVDSQYVTTFIFKGEEYVQMPKEHYVNEKTKLLKKLRIMERTLIEIRGHVATALDV